MAASSSNSPSSSSDPVVASLRPITSHPLRPTPSPPPPDSATAPSRPIKPYPLFHQPSPAAPLLGRPITPPPPPPQPSNYRGMLLPPPPADKPPSIAGASSYIRSAMAFSAGPGPRPPFTSSEQISRHFIPARYFRPSVAVAPMKSPVASTGPPKVAGVQEIPSSSEFKNYKDRDSSREDIAVTIQGRKVRLSETGPNSLYALCRSWVRSGMPQENQPVFEDSGRLLPRPLPESFVQAHSSVKIEDDSEDTQESQPANSAEHLSTHELLEGHIKHAKKVRANLRKKRLLRIERYKQRLALLLPPPAELGRYDVAPGS